jgi:hypothetical protein
MYFGHSFSDGVTHLVEWPCLFESLCLYRNLSDLVCNI